MPAYFADPHAPWQKGFVECSIGLLRRWFFPKGTDWASVSEAQLQGAIAVLNGKYRKVLGYRSAYEVAAEHGMVLDRMTQKTAGRLLQFGAEFTASLTETS